MQQPRQPQTLVRARGAARRAQVQPLLNPHDTAKQLRVLQRLLDVVNKLEPIMTDDPAAAQALASGLASLDKLYGHVRRASVPPKVTAEAGDAVLRALLLTKCAPSGAAACAALDCFVRVTG